MLEWMQKHKKYLVITVWVSALALIFASMVEWGGGGFSAVSSDSVAKVGNIYISRQEYQRKYNEIYDDLAESMRKAGIQDDGKPIPEIEQDAFRALVQERLMEMLAQDIGVSVTPNEILEKLISMPEFQDPTHNFNKEQYENLLHANRWTTESFESFVAKNLLQIKMQNFPIAPVSTLESNSFISAGKIEDKVAFQLLNKASVLKDTVIQVTDKEVREYWEKNKHRYTEPAHYKIAYIALDTSSINASKSSIEKFYKDNEKKYNAVSFEQVKSEVEQDYRKAILGLASSYMANMIKTVTAKKDMQIKPSNVITTMETQSLALLQKHFDSDLDIQDISLQDIPLYSLQLNDDGKDNSALVVSVSSGNGLLNPLEYSKDHWIVPYVLEKVQKQPLSFEQAKILVKNDLMTYKQNDEFKKIAYSKLSRVGTESTQTTIPIYLSLWQDRNGETYKQLLALGLQDMDIKQATDYIMQSSKKEGVVFLGSDKALLFSIVNQDMPNYANLVNITNAEEDALQEMKIRDLRNAMLDYAIKHYKVIDYRRQN